MSGRTLVTILYEDRRDGGRDFGLHSMVLACVADALQRDLFTLRHMIDGIPKGGDSKLLRACREDIELLRGYGVVAVFDDDRIRRLLGLAAEASADEVRCAILQGCHDPARLSIVLLQRNLEDVIRALAVCDPSLNKERVRDALGKVRQERDALLNKIAYDPASRLIRACVLEKVPSLGELVTVVARLLGEPV